MYTAAVPQPKQPTSYRTRTWKTIPAKSVVTGEAEPAIVKETECLNGEENVNGAPPGSALANGKSVLLDGLAHPLNIPL